MLLRQGLVGLFSTSTVENKNPGADIHTETKREIQKTSKEGEIQEICH
jgi:hypothetical protein